MKSRRTVLPAMREAGAGTLLYTTGAGSITADPRVANVNAAAAAARVNVSERLPRRAPGKNHVRGARSRSVFGARVAQRRQVHVEQEMFAGAK
jgi:hypothetical protein